MVMERRAKMKVVVKVGDGVQEGFETLLYRGVWVLGEVRVW